MLAHLQNTHNPFEQLNQPKTSLLVDFLHRRWIYKKKKRICFCLFAQVSQSCLYITVFNLNSTHYINVILYIFLCETNMLISSLLLDHIVYNLGCFNTKFMHNINLCLIWITYCPMRLKELCVYSIDQMMIMLSSKFLNNPLSNFSIQPIRNVAWLPTLVNNHGSHCQLSFRINFVDRCLSLEHTHFRDIIYPFLSHFNSSFWILNPVTLANKL